MEVIPFSFKKFAASPKSTFKVKDFESTSGFGLRISGRGIDHDFFFSEIRMVADSKAVLK
jgi:hypothetical protein